METDTSTTRRETLAGFLRDVALSTFVGRERECRVFREALARADADWSVLNVHAPAGLGKTVFLGVCQRIAAESKVPFLLIDAAQGIKTEAEFVHALYAAVVVYCPQATNSLSHCIDCIHTLAQRGKIVIAIDGYDQLLSLNRYIIDSFLSELPRQATVIIASRVSLEHLWMRFPAWKRWIKPLTLHPLEREQSAALLTSHGLTSEALSIAAYRYTQGHPLALSLLIPIAQREGEAAILAMMDARTDLTEELLMRWLSELGDARVQQWLEAMSLSPRTDPALLSSLLGATITQENLDELAGLPFVCRVGDAWVMSDLIREILSREFRTRSPAEYRRTRLRAIEHYADLAAGPGTEQERRTALESIYGMVGDELIRGAMFHSPPRSAGLYLEPAVMADLPELNSYMDYWRNERNASQGAPVAISDQSLDLRLQQWVVAEINEPDYLRMEELLTVMPGAVRLLRDGEQRLRGISIVQPINEVTLDYLSAQPVTGHFFRGLSTEQLSGYKVPVMQTNSLFLRLIDVRDEQDHVARSTLLREMVGLLLSSMRFVTTTPLRFYQALLLRFGFEAVPGCAHNDFGVDRPSPYFVLDVRHMPLGERLQHFIARQAGAEQDETQELTNIASVNEDVDALLSKLTEREREVALAAIEGLANCSIAARLDVSEITVKKHMSRIFEKTGARSRSQLIQRYWRASGRSE